MKEQKTIFQANKSKKQVNVVILIFDKIDFQQKLIKTDRDGDYILNKGNFAKRILQFSASLHQTQGPSIHKRNTITS